MTRRLRGRNTYGGRQETCSAYRHRGPKSSDDVALSREDGLRIFTDRGDFRFFPGGDRLGDIGLQSNPGVQRMKFD